MCSRLDVMHLVCAKVVVPLCAADRHIQVASQATAPLASILCVLVQVLLLHRLSTTPISTSLKN